MTARDDRGAADASPASARPFRGDIDGLRALAILLVVGFHIGFGFVGGGFIGVDVFFVISGYLITRNLLAETTGTGRVAFARFWAKRIRRLVPALTLMVAVVLLAATVILSPLAVTTAADQGRAAVLYVSNLGFARESTDYFGGDLTTSLFLHTWSLGVEEQFYVVWPALVGLLAWTFRRIPGRGRSVRVRLIAGFAVVAVVSFAINLIQTASGSAYAFFALPARAWEFAVAGLLACSPWPAIVGRRSVATAMALAGLVLLAVATLWLDDATLYPGAWALFPVVGTLLLLAAGTTSRDRPLGLNPISQLLALEPFQWLGRLSYSWYLWHWPVILLTVSATGYNRKVVRTAAALAALMIAAAAYHLVENRVRFSRWLVASSRRTFMVGAALTIVVVALTFGVQHRAASELEQLAIRSASGDGPPVSLEDVRRSRVNLVCPRERRTSAGVGYCEAGDADGSQTVLLVGDSHAGHWQPAFAAAAQTDGVRLVVRWKSRCPSVPVRLAARGSTDEDTGCAEFRAQTDSLIAELHPTAVVMSNSYGWRSSVLDGDDDRAKVAAWAQAFRSEVTSLHARGIRTGSIVDNPDLPTDPLDCLADADAPEACAVPRDQALSGTRAIERAERAVRIEVGGVPALDLTDVFCGPDVCPVVIDGTYVYSDHAHLYEGFVLTQTDQVRAFLRSILR